MKNILFNHGLTTKELGHNFIVFDEIESTNDYLNEKANDLAHGSVVKAIYQTKGKGRLDHKWHGEKNTSLMFSVLIKTKMNATLKIKIVFAAAIALFHTIKKLYNITTSIKWPNDLYFSDKKIAGILCQMQNDFVIAGIGINVNQQDFPEEIQNIASSLLLITGIKVDLNMFLANFLNYFENTINTLCTEGFYPIREEITKNFYLMNKEVNIETPKKTIHGIVKGMDDDGQLLLDVSGKIKKIMAGDVHICF